MSVQKLIASYVVFVLPTLNKTYLIWFDIDKYVLFLNVF